tara:strand:+ start:304 stop:714 length:411 start_codon:yes stop_codon:yes gene_type:complete
VKKLKTLFTITLVIDIIAIAPLFLMIFIPAMKEEMVYSQFSGMAENELAKEISDLFHFVFTFIAMAMVIAVGASIRIAVLEAAKTAAMILFIVHLGWVLPDYVNLAMGGAHPPIPVMLLSTIPVIVLAYGWKKGEI